MINIDELDFKMRAKYGCIHVSTFEEERFLQFATARFGKDRKIWQWSATQGVYWNERRQKTADELRAEGKKETKKEFVNERRVENDTEDFISALLWIKKAARDKPDADNLVLMYDVHPFIEYPLVRRHIRELAIQLPHTGTSLLLVGPMLRIDGDLEKTVTLYDFPLPDEDEMYKLSLAVQTRNPHRIKDKLPGEGIGRVARACLGLTRDEAENVLSKSASKHGKLDLGEISYEKREILEKGGLVVREPEKSIDDVGGMDRLKDYIRRVQKARTDPRAKEYGVPTPKGINLLGPPGTGKSLLADAVASFFQLPLIVFEIGQFKGSLVGESEGKLRNAFRRINAIGPSVVRFDEMEKMFSGMTGPSTDSGVGQEMGGMTLTWLQEQKTAYCIGTMNRVIHPNGELRVLPELLRKGRWDELWIIPLPNRIQRKEIVEIHLRRRDRNPEKFDTARIAEVCEGFSGAEIETTVNDTLFHVFSEDREIVTDDLVEAIKRTTPLSTTMKEEIDQLTKWAKTRNIRSASSEEAKTVREPSKVRTVS